MHVNLRVLRRLREVFSNWIFTALFFVRVLGGRLVLWRALCCLVSRKWPLDSCCAEVVYFSKTKTFASVFQFSLNMQARGIPHAGLVCCFLFFAGFWGVTWLLVQLVACCPCWHQAFTWTSVNSLRLRLSRLFCGTVVSCHGLKNVFKPWLKYFALQFGLYLVFIF